MWKCLCNKRAMCVKWWFIRTNTIKANFVRVLRLKCGNNIMEKVLWNSVFWMSFTFVSKLQQLLKLGLWPWKTIFILDSYTSILFVKVSVFLAKESMRHALKLSKQLNFFLLLSTVSTMLEIIANFFLFSILNMEKNVF